MGLDSVDMALNDKDEQMLREELCRICSRLWQRELIAANDGNVSVRLTENAILCTPSGVSKGFLRPENLVVTDLQCDKLSGSMAPSSELKMHGEIYRRRPDVQAVVHAHPPHATAFAVAGLALPTYVMPEIDVLLGAVPLVGYETPGTEQLAVAAGQAAAGVGVSALLLANHGAVTFGPSLEMAWLRMESLDQCCRILLLAMQAGGWRQIPSGQRQELDDLKTYLQ